MAQIAERYEVSPSTVHNWFRRASIQARPSAATLRTDIDDGDMATRYITDRQTAAEIASALGCSQSLVYARLDRLGIPRRPPKPRKSPRPTAAELRRLYDQEQLSVSQIAHRFDVTPNATYRWLHDSGISLRDRDSRERIDLDELGRLYGSGATGSELARRYNCSTTTIYRRLDDAQIPRRAAVAINRDALIDALDEGLSASDIGAAFEISVSAVCRALEREGLQTETQKKRSQASEHYLALVEEAERTGKADYETMQWLQARTTSNTRRSG